MGRCWTGPDTGRGDAASVTRIPRRIAVGEPTPPGLFGQLHHPHRRLWNRALVRALRSSGQLSTPMPQRCSGRASAA
jgi:hypothetical protein